MDISVTFCRKNGERRKSGVGSTKNRQWAKPVSFNPYPILMNHRKHEGAIYREAIGGFEKRGQPRFHSDWFE